MILHCLEWGWRIFKFEAMEEIDIESLGSAVVPLMDESSEATFRSYENLRIWLRDQVEYLIERDFSRLLQILYRIDVQEARIKRLVSENEGEDAAGIIADLILERQAQKIAARKKFTPGEDGKYFSD